MKLRLFTIILLIFALPCYAGNFAGVGDYVFTGVIGEDVRAHGATGDGATDDHVAFENAIAAASGGTVHVPKAATSYKLEDNVTVPASVTVIFQQGALLSIDVTKTFTVAGTIDAGLWQIFSGAGTASFGVGSCQEVYPEWWGAVGDGSFDCTAAFDSAMIAAQTIGRLKISAGRYRITSPLKNFPAGAFAYATYGYIIEGCGTETQMEYWGTTGYLFEVDSNDPTNVSTPVGVTIQDLHIQAGSVTSADVGGAILVVGSFVNINRITTHYLDDATAIHVRSRITNVAESSMTNDTNRDFTTTGAGASEKYAIKFTSFVRAQTLKSVIVRLGITGAPAGTVHAEIWTDAAGLPDTQVTGGDSDSVTINTISAAADGEDITLDFGDIGSRPQITSSTTYWLVLSTADYVYSDGATELRLRVDAGDGGTDEFAIYDFGGSSWSSSDDGANYTAECRYGQAIGVNVTNCGFQSNVAVERAFWLEDVGFLNINNCYADAVEGIRSEYGYLEAHNVYLMTSGVAVYATGWTRMFGGVIEGSVDYPLYFGGVGHIHTLFGVSNSLAPVTWQSGTYVIQESCAKDWWWSPLADVVPDNWHYRIVPAESDNKRWDTSGAAFIADADALNGYATRFDSINDYIQVTFGTTKNYSFLPRGTYKATVWAKDTNQVADDFMIISDFYDAGWHTDFGVDYTLTADYQPYYCFLRVDSTQVGDIGYQKRLWIRKVTGAANTINVSHVIFEYLGPDDPGTIDLTAIAGDHSNGDEARRSKVEFWGSRTNHYSGALAQIEAKHRGTGDDYEGEIDFKINTGVEPYTTLKSVLKLSSEVQVFPENDASPDIEDGNVWMTNNTSPTTVTDFHGAFITGKMITVIINDNNTTFDFTGSDLKGNGGVDWTPRVNDYLIATKGDADDWRCLVSPQQSFGDGTNYTNIASDGDLSFVGTAKVETLRMAEISTPGAVANVGAAYPKADNNLYFQDGAGVERSVGLSDYAGIYTSDSAVEITILLVDALEPITIFTADMPELISNGAHGTDSITIGSTGVYGVSFHACAFSAANNKVFAFFGFEIAASGSTISGVTQADPGVVTATAHGFTNGQRVKITGVVGMTELNGQVYTVANKADNTFELNDDNGADINTGGYTAYDSAGTAFLATRLDQIHIHRKFAVSPDVGPISSCGLVSLTAGNTVEAFVKGLTDNTNLTICVCQLFIEKK